MERIYPDDRQKVQEIVDEIMRNPAIRNFEVEYRVRSNDGNLVFLYDRGIIIRNQSGKPVRMIGAAQDISDRKRLEHELLQKELDRQKLISQATIDTQEQERAEIGKELHDNVNQILTTTKLYLEIIQSSPDMSQELLTKANQNIINVINEIRQLSRSLMDPSLGDLGLVDSVKDLIENINLTRSILLTFTATESLELELDASRKLMVFRIIQEAVNNIIRHAKATEGNIILKKIKNTVRLKITDNGIGFNPGQIRKGIGIKNITNRVYLTNGQLHIQSRPGKGTTLDIKIPIQKSPN
jgi:two-component system sensor histidine kinase UhpB